MEASNTYFNGDINRQDGLNLCATVFIVNHCEMEGTLSKIFTPVKKSLL